MRHSTISISPRTIVITLLMLISILVLYSIREILLAFFVAVIIMSALNPSVTWLESKKITRPLGILLMFVIVIGLLSVLLAFVVPPLAKEAGKLFQDFQVSQFNLPDQFSDLQLTVDDLGNLASQFGSSIGSVLNVVSSTFSLVLFAFTTIVMAFYLLIDRPFLHNKITWADQTPKMKRIIKQFIENMELQLGGWVRGQLLLMFSIGFITYACLLILGIPYALPLAVIAGLLELLPNLGPTLAAVPAVIVAFGLVDPTMGLIVLVLYIVIQQLENHILVPKIMKAAVDVEPLASILLILIGIKLGGVLGALLSIPIYIIMRSAFHTYIRERATPEDK